MARPFASYILCATPRSGSTLLCEMLGATGVAGRPNSFFRPEDIAEWARAWGLPDPDETDAPSFDRAYLSALLREGRAGTGTFGLRLMWDSLAEASHRLNRALGSDRDVAAQFEAAFGPPLYVHISRGDKVAQAVSRVRAEQSGIWHRAADGKMQEGADSAQPLRYDGARIAEILDDLQRGDEAWRDFFDAHCIRPLTLSYEGVAQDPQAALGTILSTLGLDPDLAHATPVRTSKLADAVSKAWEDRFRQEHP